MKNITYIHFLIYIIISNINIISNHRNRRSSLSKTNKMRQKYRGNNIKKNKNIRDYILNQKNKRKNIKLKNDNINDLRIELNHNFNNWLKIEYKSSNLFNDNKNDEIFYSDNNFLDYNIVSYNGEKKIINEDYKKNDFLIRFYNNKNNQGEEYMTLLSINSEKTNNNDNSNENNNQQIKKIDNYIQHQNNLNIKDSINYRNYYGDEEFEFGLNEGRSIHHQDYNSMRYSSRNSHYKSSHPTTYTSNTNQGNKSKLSEYMNSIYQIMMVFFFLGFIYKFIFGNRQNDKYALAWYEANKDYFKERYEIFGLVEDEENGSFKTDDNMKDCIMIKESPNVYKLICGNYRYIKYIAISLQFHKRYDMSLFIASIFITLKDKIVFQVTFNSVDPCGWVFCIGKKNQCAILKDNYEDLNCFCEIFQPNFMDESMCLISEDLDVINELFNNKSLLQYYKSVEPYIETIYYSDIINLLTEENNIYFSFEIDLTASYQNRIFLEITHFVNVLVDSIAQIKYTKEFKDKVTNNRNLYKENKINESMQKEDQWENAKDIIGYNIYDVNLDQILEKEEEERKIEEEKRKQEEERKKKEAADRNFGRHRKKY